MPLDSIGYLSPTGYVETKIVDADGEVLRRAADIIEKNGWWDGKPEGGTETNNCLVTSIVVARRGNRNTGTEYQRLGFRSGADAAAWNDAPRRTAAEVIARLRSAAEQGAS